MRIVLATKFSVVWGTAIARDGEGRPFFQSENNPAPSYGKSDILGPGSGALMPENMTVLRLTETELARDLHAVLKKVQQGVEVIVEQEHRPVAIIRTPERPGRPISHCIALAKAHEAKLGYAPIPDPEFAGDVQAAMDAHREGLNPPSWD